MINNVWYLSEEEAKRYLADLLALLRERRGDPDACNQIIEQYDGMCVIRHSHDYNLAVAESWND